MPLHIETPLLLSRPLSLIAERSVWLKFDALQPAGSFKIRGIGHACEAYRRRGAQRFISSSGGNAGLAVAYAGRTMGLPVTVVVPETTSETAIKLLRQENAEVIVHGASWQEANVLAQSLIRAADAFIHPFDDALVWQGHATLIEEVARTGLKPDAIVLSVGGGGLLAGVSEGLERHDWGQVPIVAVETAGAASFRAALAAGQPVSLERITSIAATLGAKRVCDQAVAWAKRRPIESLVVTDQDALTACERFLDDHRVLVEPACGASLAVVYERAPVLEQFDTILVVVCGGATASLDQIRRWRAEML